MSSISTRTFRDKANQIYARYDADFAGRPRATRNLELLDEIIDDLETLIDKARKSEELKNTPLFLEAVGAAVESLQTYQNERGEIIKAKEQPRAEEAAHAATKANCLMGIYRRHFAGKSRATRDIRLLEKLLEELEKVQAQMDSLIDAGAPGTDEDIVVVNDQLELYKSELEQIRNAQMIESPEDRASILAELANEQFLIYNQQFSGKNRASRSIALLKRMIENLNDYRKRMQAIQELPNVTLPVNTSNISVITENLRLYENELGQIQSAAASLSPVERAGALGQAANELHDLYTNHFAGKERVTRDLDQLTEICDGLWYVSLLMEEIEENDVVDFNAQNLEYVYEWWSNYEREWLLVRDAKNPNPDSDQEE